MSLLLSKVHSADAQAFVKDLSQRDHFSLFVSWRTYSKSNW